MESSRLRQNSKRPRAREKRCNKQTSTNAPKKNKIDKNAKRSASKRKMSVQSALLRNARLSKMTVKSCVTMPRKPKKLQAKP